jgi:glycosyltransferase involved in cell wall biosynthesis
MNSNKSLSIIVPCFNESENIELFKKKLEENNLLNYQLYYIDDGSTDDTWEQIIIQSKKDTKVYGIKLLRNFGKNSAILAGLKNQSSDFSIIIDCDLQHPLEKIPEMIEYYNNGYKIVSTVRDSDKEGFFRELGSKLFYFFMRNFSNVKYYFRTTDFMLIDKEIINFFLSIPEDDKNIKNFIYWSGYKKKELKIEINKRDYGISKFNLYKLFKLSINHFASFSILPLKLIGYLGLALVLISILFLFYSFIVNFFGLSFISIQTIIIIFNSLFTGLIMMAIGLLAIYVARIDKHLMQRPNYIIAEKTK